MDRIVTETPVAEKTVKVKLRHNFLHYMLMLGIAVVLNIFFVVVLSLVYPAPTYSQYCPQESVTPTDSVSCDALGGVWVEYSPTSGTTMTAPKLNGVCDMYSKCAVSYQTANNMHILYFFLIMIVIGIIAGSTVQINSLVISSGLLYGSILAIILGAFSYWGAAGTWVRLIIAIVGLATLVYIGYRRFPSQ